MNNIDRPYNDENEWICYLCGQETDEMEGCKIEYEAVDPLDGMIVNEIKDVWFCVQCYDEFKHKEKRRSDGVFFFEESDLEIKINESHRYKYEVLSVISEIIDGFTNVDHINKNKIAWLRWKVDNWKTSGDSMLAEVESKVLDLANASLDLYNNKGE